MYFHPLIRHDGRRLAKRSRQREKQRKRGVRARERKEKKRERGVGWVSYMEAPY